MSRSLLGRPLREAPGDVLVLVVTLAGLQESRGQGSRQLWLQAATERFTVVSGFLGRMAHDLEILLQLQVGLVDSLPLSLFRAAVLSLLYTGSTRPGSSCLGGTVTGDILRGWPRGRV